MRKRPHSPLGRNKQWKVVLSSDLRLLHREATTYRCWYIGGVEYVITDPLSNDIGE